ncbi:MAG: cell wall-binding repeat-containing protein [Oscillospiraceae bacterium]|jgi:uncharacterized protein YkwD/putative cell wall-binding protein|nr:cell wall-binding repeat-containing protein [Oscillospiraceae bacterium]
MKKILSTFSIALILCIILSLASVPAFGVAAKDTYIGESASAVEQEGSQPLFNRGIYGSVNVKVTEAYAEAWKVLDLVNTERAKVGAPKLTMNSRLLTAAMQRAAETTIYFSHTRPDGSSCFNITSWSSAAGENIAAGQRNAAEVMKSWMNSSGHKANILNAKFSSIGIGAVYHNGTYYWAQFFDGGSSSSAAKSTSSPTVTHTIPVLDKFLDVYGTTTSVTVNEGAGVVHPTVYNRNVAVGWTAILENSSFEYYSANEVIAYGSGGKIYGVRPGTVVVRAGVNNGLESGVNFNVTVKEVAGNPTGVSVSLPSNVIEIRDIIKATATVTPSTAKNKAVTWKSLNTSIATVDASGNVTGVGLGTTQIVATTVARKYEASATITVIETPLPSNAIRISGGGRITTAIEISKKGWTSSENVVLTNSRSFADALAGGSLAYALDAPILLTAGGNTLEHEVLEELVRLSAKKVYILGGSSSVSDFIERSLSSYQPERLSGGSRYETAAAIAQKLDELRGTPATEVYIADGSNFPDALAVSPVAALRSAPILFTYNAKSTLGNEIHAATKSYADGLTEAKITLIGGTSSISEAAAATLGTEAANRIAGGNRYDTSLKILDANRELFTGNIVTFATGQNFPDALAGSSFAAKNRAPLVLLNHSNSVLVPGVREALTEMGASSFYIFGGSSSLSNKCVINHLP